MASVRGRTEPLLIGIAGGTGSGKTTLARSLRALLPDAATTLVQHDWYYLDRSHLSEPDRDRVNFDEPAALENSLLVEHLRALKLGQSVECPQYDFASHTRKKRGVEVSPHPVIVVEGILLFAIDAVSACFDLRLYMDVPDDVRLLRRIRRDVVERGRTLESVHAQYEASVKPMHDIYGPVSRRRAHLIVPGDGDSEPALNVVAGYLRHQVEQR